MWGVTQRRRVQPVCGRRSSIIADGTRKTPAAPEHQPAARRDQFFSGNKNIYRQYAFETFISSLLPRNFSIWNIWNSGKMARQIFYHLTMVVQNAMLEPHLAQAPVQQEWCCLFVLLNDVCQTHKLQACGNDYQWLQREEGEKFKTTHQKKYENSLRIGDLEIS